MGIPLQQFYHGLHRLGLLQVRLILTWNDFNPNWKLVLCMCLGGNVGPGCCSYTETHLHQYYATYCTAFHGHATPALPQCPTQPTGISGTFYSTLTLSCSSSLLTFWLHCRVLLLQGSALASKFYPTSYPTGCPGSSTTYCTAKSIFGCV